MLPSGAVPVPTCADMCADPALALAWNEGNASFRPWSPTSGWPGLSFGNEPWFFILLAALLGEGHVPAGSILDAGANFGVQSCMLSRLAPDRDVHAFEPQIDILRQVRRAYVGKPGFERLHTRHLALAAKPGTLDLGATPSHGPTFSLGAGATALTTKARATKAQDLAPEDTRMSDSSVRVETIERRFATERLGMLHLDMEGSELLALEGARGVVSRDRPILGTELHVHRQGAAHSKKHLAYFDEANYTTFLVDELCGAWHDCRNMIHFPPGSAGPHDSPTVRALVRTGYLLPVSQRNIMQLAKPCRRKESDRWSGGVSMRCCLCCLRRDSRTTEATITTPECPSAAAMLARREWLQQATPMVQKVRDLLIWCEGFQRGRS